MQEEIGSLHKEVNNLNAELRQTKEYIQVLHEQQNKFKKISYINCKTHSLYKNSHNNVILQSKFLIKQPPQQKLPQKNSRIYLFNLVY